MNAIILAIALFTVPVAPDAVPQQNSNCACRAEGQRDQYGNYPMGEGYHNTIRGACNAAVQACVNAAPHSRYLPCRVVASRCN